ncbi:enterobactin/ferric enterobactin esterase [Tautonia plasticadhaerens]|uniref:Enterobactin/ferric enterobactin esterase n=1 Tax=Tautonia plasticadhaerens TaxID=2527974 RepID=A0A518GWN4_9BACT|nr:enterobactin/ferric enterobactin esterase [Tautonia plasticadhaerens]
MRPDKGGHFTRKSASDASLVAFVVEAPADADPAPRLEGMVTRQQGRDLTPIGDSGLWATVLEVPNDQKFNYEFSSGRGRGRGRIGGGTVEMPGWAPPPESAERPGQAYGEFRPFDFRSEVFGNDRTGWSYVPAAYDGSGPAALMVFQDGDAYRREHVGTVVENLIADGDMPVTILALLNPGVNDDGSSNRSVEYDTMSDRYATFLAEEVMPRLESEFDLRDDPSSRAIGGASSGGICAFTVAWERPDLFARVCSHIGSFTDIRGGGSYPGVVRESDKKPIAKVVLHDGRNDLINRFGDWWEANNRMHQALSESGYEVEFVTDESFHGYQAAGRVLPETLRMTWEGWDD